MSGRPEAMVSLIPVEMSYDPEALADEVRPVRATEPDPPMFLTPPEGIKIPEVFSPYA